MIQEFILPDIGEGIVECELVEWLVQEGDIITEDQPVADVMTDKALVQIPSMHHGKVVKLHYQQGEIAKVHAPLFAVETESGETVAIETVANSTAEETAAPVLAQKAAPATSGGKIIKDFILPDIGEGIVECELVEWIVKEGDIVVEDQPVADVMTDKALYRFRVWIMAVSLSCIASKAKSPRFTRLCLPLRLMRKKGLPLLPKLKLLLFKQKLQHKRVHQHRQLIKLQVLLQILLTVTVKRWLAQRYVVLLVSTASISPRCTVLVKTVVY